MNINITDKAAKYMNRMIRFSGGDADAGFRLLVSPGGCSGFNSSFSVESAPQEGDVVLERHGVRIFLPAGSRFLLEGVTVDYADTAMATGLSFINPNAQSCACNSSAVAASSQGATVISISSIQRKH